MKYFLFLFLLASTYFPCFAQATGIQFEVSFIASSRFGKVNGKFTKAQIQISKDEKSAQAEVEISSIQTGNKMRDKHLLDPDFFDSEKYPKASFTLDSLTPMDENHFRGTGKMTIKNITKEIVFSLSRKDSGKMKTYTGSTEINRFDFGINYDSVINKISEKVIINFLISKE